MKIIHRATAWLYVVWLSLRGLLFHRTYDHVIYCGREFRLLHGHKWPIWKLESLDELETIDVHQQDFRRVRTARNYWSSVRFHYRLLMYDWYPVWAYHGIKDWNRYPGFWGE